jgi:hypothetical protein
MEKKMLITEPVKEWNTYSDEFRYVIRYACMLDNKIETSLVMEKTKEAVLARMAKVHDTFFADEIAAGDRIMKIDEAEENRIDWQKKLAT